MIIGYSMRMIKGDKFILLFIFTVTLGNFEKKTNEIK